MQPAINQEAKTKITKARINMIMKQPFFGQLALRLKIVEDSTLNPPTLATDGRTMYYHPKWVLDHDQDVVVSAVAHEVGHVVFDHMSRRNGRTPKRWNYAGDYVINAMLKDCGFTVPSDWLYDPAFANKTTDEVYRILPPDDQGGGGSGSGTGTAPFDMVKDSPLSPQEAQDWEHATVQAADAQAKHQQGNMPGSLKRFIKEVLREKADWRSVMSRFVTEVSREDYSYARLNRRFASLGIYLPGLYSENMGELAAGIDTSGSISREILDAFGGHLSEIKNQMRPTKVTNIYCDARVNRVDEFEQDDEMTFEGCGGGGTDLRKIFDHIKNNGIEPKCLCVLTDGYTPFPNEAPPYPTLWLMTTDVVPPFGEVVRIEL